MAGTPFSWMWGDPANTVDRIRDLRARLEKAEKEEADRLRRKKARRIRKLTKLAMAGKLKGQRRG